MGGESGATKISKQKCGRMTGSKALKALGNGAKHRFTGWGWKSSKKGGGVKTERTIRGGIQGGGTREEKNAGKERDRVDRRNLFSRWEKNEKAARR